jgi:hypothetical protein
MILCSRNKQNHKNKGETGILSMNFAFDLRGVGLVKATFSFHFTSSTGPREREALYKKVMNGASAPWANPINIDLNTLQRQMNDKTIHNAPHHVS